MNNILDFEVKDQDCGWQAKSGKNHLCENAHFWRMHTRLWQFAVEDYLVFTALHGMQTRSCD